MRVVYVHGNKAVAGWRFGWAEWLQGALQFHGYDTVFETMPDSVDGRARFWLPFMEKQLRIGRGDVIVGWSTGAVAAMRYAELHQVGGLVLVAPHYTDLGSQLEAASGWFTAPWDWPVIRANTGHRAVFRSDCDPAVPAAETYHIICQLRAAEYQVPGVGHFTKEETLPLLLDYLLGLPLLLDYLLGVLR